MTLDPGVLAAIITAGVALLVGILNLTLLAFRIRLEFREDRARVMTVRRLLRYKGFRVRSFKELKKRLKGFEDDELRRLLIGAGAVCFEGLGNSEMWGLVKHNEDRLPTEPES